VVLDLIAHTIQEKRTSQQFILLEGMCNHGKLMHDDDKFSLRLMDEFFRIEKKVGQVAGIIGLQFDSDKEYIDDHELVWEEFPEPEEKPAEPEKQYDEDGNEIVPEPAEDAEEGEKKEPAFKPEDYKWTVSDRKPMNLPTLYL
jgi:hypothetical protein